MSTTDRVRTVGINTFAAGMCLQAALQADGPGVRAFSLFLAAACGTVAALHYGEISREPTDANEPKGDDDE